MTTPRAAAFSQLPKEPPVPHPCTTNRIALEDALNAALAPLLPPLLMGSHLIPYPDPIAPTYRVLAGAPPPDSGRMQGIDALVAIHNNGFTVRPFHLSDACASAYGDPVSCAHAVVNIVAPIIHRGTP